MTEAIESENSYIFDPENASEIARLRERNDVLKKALGGLFPERTDLAGITRILDVGCGPGGWVVDVAHSYPDTKVVGIDINKTMLDSARDLAQQRSTLTNVKFIKMNVLHPLEFPDHSFDLVNMRAALEYIPRANWHALLNECYRITKPGGILRLTESDRIAHTNSHAFEAYHSFYSRMLYKGGYGFSPDGQTFGMTPMLEKLLRDVGCLHTDMKSYALDISYNTKLQKDYRRLIEGRFDKVQHLLLEKGLETPEKLADLYKKLLDDLVQKTFCGVIYVLIFCGTK